MIDVNWLIQHECTYINQRNTDMKRFFITKCVLSSFMYVHTYVYMDWETDKVNHDIISRSY